MDKGANVDGYVTPFDAYKMSLKRAGHYSHLNVSGFWMGSGNGIGYGTEECSIGYPWHRQVAKSDFDFAFVFWILDLRRQLQIDK